MVIQQFLESFFQAFQEFLNPILHQKYKIEFRAFQSNIGNVWDKYPNTFLTYGINTVKKQTPWVKSYKNFEGKVIKEVAQFNEYEIQLDFYANSIWQEKRTVKNVLEENVSLLVLLEMRNYFDFFCSYGLENLDTKNVSLFYLQDTDIFLAEKIDSSQVFERLSRKIIFRINEELTLINEGYPLDFIEVKIEEKKGDRK